jgi:hypothetical protein
MANEKKEGNNEYFSELSKPLLFAGGILMMNSNTYSSVYTTNLVFNRFNKAHTNKQILR